MNSITKERIELFIKNPLENGLTRSEQMEVARIALASLEAEPQCNPLDAVTRTAAGGKIMDVKEKVLQVMRSRAALREKALGGEYPFTIATWNLRLAMEKEFPDEEWRSADLRKILMEMAKDGTVSKDTHASRIGQAVWRLAARQ
ncbi:Eaa protein [Escherichia coli TA280]|nr:Eaa protein [Escherichia coli TA280]